MEEALQKVFETYSKETERQCRALSIGYITTAEYNAAIIKATMKLSEELLVGLTLVRQ